MTSAAVDGPADRHGRGRRYPVRRHPVRRHPVRRHGSRGRPRRRPEAGGGGARARPRRARRRAGRLRSRASRDGFRALADPEYLAGSQRVAPGIGRLYGVRWPLTAAVDRGFRLATRRTGSDGLLEIAARLYQEPELERRWFAFGLLDRVLLDDPERAWQLLRRGAREAADWITVDTLAHPVGRGILLEAYRWAELEGLVFSPSRWERRLVGSTVATAAVRRSPSRPDAGRRSARPGPRRRAHRRRRAGRPEGARLGAPLSDDRRRRRRPRVRGTPGRRRRRDRRRLPRLGAARRPRQAAARAGGRDPDPPRRHPSPGRSPVDVTRGGDRGALPGRARLGPDAHIDRFPDPAAPSAGDPSQ